MKKWLIVFNSDSKKRGFYAISTKTSFVGERGKIDWYPTVDEKRCTFCKICYDFYFRKVYFFDEVNQKVLVTHPYECVVLCSGCQAKCPVQAISFPERRDFEHFVAYEDE
jgi:NAD-dependent dihydropyrimidine dehydrogenase PreA subunit